MYKCMYVNVNVHVYVCVRLAGWEGAGIRVSGAAIGKFNVELGNPKL